MVGVLDTNYFEFVEDGVLEPGCRPNFLGVFKVSNILNSRVYVHGSSRKAFSNEEGKTFQETVLGHFIDEVYLHNFFLGIIPQDPLYALAAVWGDDGGDRMVDFFCYSGINGWPGNPDVSGYVFKNGVWQEVCRDITCGDTLIVLGEEEKHRRTCPGLEAYLKNPPKIPGLRAVQREF